MSSQTSNQTRTIIAIVIAIFAVLMIVAVPLITNSMLNPIVSGQLERIASVKAQGTPDGNAQAALLAPSPWIVTFFYPFWATLSFVAGIALLVTLREFYRGVSWTRGFALMMLSVPAIGAGFMIVPWINFVGSVKGGFPPAVLIMAIGLMPYFTVVFASQGDLRQKVAEFLVFLMLGVSAAENFANGHASFRILYGHPQRPLIPDDIAVLWLSYLGLWISTGLLLATIYLLGNRKASGWYTGMIAGLTTLAASGATHYFRNSTNDYLYGALMGLCLVILLVIPAVKQRLLESPPTQEKKPQAQVFQTKPI